MADDSQMPEGVTIDRSADVPRRVDKRSVMRMLHDELAAHYGKEPKHSDAGGPAKTVDQFVDEAVKGAPAPGSDEY